MSSTMLTDTTFRCAVSAKGDVTILIYTEGYDVKDGPGGTHWTLSSIGTPNEAIASIGNSLAELEDGILKVPMEITRYAAFCATSLNQGIPRMELPSQALVRRPDFSTWPWARKRYNSSQEMQNEYEALLRSMGINDSPYGTEVDPSIHLMDLAKLFQMSCSSVNCFPTKAPSPREHCPHVLRFEPSQPAAPLDLKVYAIRETPNLLLWARGGTYGIGDNLRLRQAFWREDFTRAISNGTWRDVLEHLNEHLTPCGELSTKDIVLGAPSPDTGHFRDWQSTVGDETACIDLDALLSKLADLHPAAYTRDSSLTAWFLSYCKVMDACTPAQAETAQDAPAASPAG